MITTDGSLITFLMCYSRSRSIILPHLIVVETLNRWSVGIQWCVTMKKLWHKETEKDWKWVIISLCRQHLRNWQSDWWMILGSLWCVGEIVRHNNNDKTEGPDIDVSYEIDENESQYALALTLNNYQKVGTRNTDQYWPLLSRSNSVQRNWQSKLAWETDSRYRLKFSVS